MIRRVMSRPSVTPQAPKNYPKVQLANLPRNLTLSDVHRVVENTGLAPVVSVAAGWWRGELEEVGRRVVVFSVVGGL